MEHPPDVAGAELSFGGERMPDDRTVEMDRPAIVVSCDSHVGPKLVEHLRPYCPKKYLDAFDADVARQQAHASPPANTLNDQMDSQMRRTRRLFEHPNLSRPGHWDADARLADMDNDGVAAEVIWHFSQNGENYPHVEGVFQERSAPARSR